MVGLSHELLNVRLSIYVFVLYFSHFVKISWWKGSQA